MSVVEELDNLTELRLPAPATLADYYRLRVILDALIDEVGEDESHILAPFMDHVGELMEEYETPMSRSCELPKTPNAETIAAIDELESGGGKSFSSIEELMAELNTGGELVSLPFLLPEILPGG